MSSMRLMVFTRLRDEFADQVHKGEPSERLDQFHTFLAGQGLKLGPSLFDEAARKLEIENGGSNTLSECIASAEAAPFSKKQFFLLDTNGEFPQKTPENSQAIEEAQSQFADVIRDVSPKAVPGRR